MKVPTNRAKFMDELRINLDDIICGGHFGRSYLAKRDCSRIMGREYFIEYTEEDAPQLITFVEYGTKNELRIEFCEEDDALRFYRNNEFWLSLEFNMYRNKTTFTAAVAVWVERSRERR